jgi:uncharacterized membrane protein
MNLITLSLDKKFPHPKCGRGAVDPLASHQPFVANFVVQDVSILSKREGKSLTPHATPERLKAFSDGVFAVLITILVLDLHPPHHPTFQDLLALWPTWVSYSVSYLFIAIVWINHHHLMRYAGEATARLMWLNFAHLFSVSLLPLATEWMAVSRLAPQPVAFYAADFVLVNATYLGLIGELLEKRPSAPVRTTERRHMRLRALVTLGCFASAVLIALLLPLAALGLCIGCLTLYTRPE